jgi:CRISPR-associated endoribonuclease Cas6
MNISYKKIKFIISLSKKVLFSVRSPFIFRSVIGFQLRKICCIAHNNVCADCMFNATCIYGLTFESIVPKNNVVLSGRDRISHPIIISVDDFMKEEMDSVILEITFLGPAIPYIPYFYYALKKGGESGILEERIQYKINDIIEFSNTDKERSLMINEEQINTGIEPEIWEFNQKIETNNKKCYTISLLSPLRIKKMGSFVRRLDENEFAMCLHRRAQVLCSQYGHNDFNGEYQFSGNWTITEKNLRWRDYVHYSARQKSEMPMGGLIGDFTVSGDFSSYECALLQFAELFHGGKNTNFGLGKIKILEKETT